MIEIVLGIISIIYVWLVYLILISVKPTKYDKNYKKPITVIIPCYNEEPKYLIRCINSILEADGEKQIILVDNNSNKEPTIQAINSFRKNKAILILDEKRQGKRFAHSKGLMHAKYEIIIFVDSDTIIDKSALIELVKPFKDSAIGGATGQIRLANKNVNLITRCIDSMFISAFSLFRNSSTKIGFMQVMSGALSAYRKSDLIKLEKGYLNQKFLGRQCAISDDRYLTTRIQTKLGKKISFNEKALAYTYMPSTIIGFWKVVERWKRGMIREILLMWKEPKKNAKMLFFDTQFNFIMFNITMVLRLILMINLIINFSFQSLILLVSWLILMNFLWGAYVLVNYPKEFPYKIVYTVLNEFFWVFSYFQALINIRNQGKWVTR